MGYQHYGCDDYLPPRWLPAHQWLRLRVSHHHYAMTPDAQGGWQDILLQELSNLREIIAVPSNIHMPDRSLPQSSRLLSRAMSWCLSEGPQGHIMSWPSPRCILADLHNKCPQLPLLLHRVATYKLLWCYLRCKVLWHLTGNYKRPWFMGSKSSGVAGTVGGQPWCSRYGCRMQLPL
jgi:hypothetical protein